MITINKYVPEVSFSSFYKNLEMPNLEKTIKKVKIFSKKAIPIVASSYLLFLLLQKKSTTENPALSNEVTDLTCPVPTILPPLMRNICGIGLGFTPDFFESLSEAFNTCEAKLENPVSNNILEIQNNSEEYPTVYENTSGLGSNIGEFPQLRPANTSILEGLPHFNSAIVPEISKKRFNDRILDKQSSSNETSAKVQDAFDKNLINQSICQNDELHSSVVLAQSKNKPYECSDVCDITLQPKNFQFLDPNFLKLSSMKTSDVREFNQNPRIGEDVIVDDLVLDPNFLKPSSTTPLYDREFNQKPPSGEVVKLDDLKKNIQNQTCPLQQKEKVPSYPYYSQARKFGFQALEIVGQGTWMIAKAMGWTAHAVFRAALHV